MLYLILIGIGIFIYAIADIFHDRSSNIASWRTSILAKIAEYYYGKDSLDKSLVSFIGPNDFSHFRKHKSSKVTFLGKLYDRLRSSLFVMFSDIWHFSDSVKRVMVMFMLFVVLNIVLPFFSALFIALGTYAVFAFVFHMYYTYILTNKKSLRYSIIFTFIGILLVAGIYWGVPKLLGDTKYFSFTPNEELILDMELEIKRHVNHQRDLEITIDSLKSIIRCGSISNDLTNLTQ